MCLFSCFLLSHLLVFSLAFPVCILVCHAIIPAVSLGIRGELDRMISVPICPDRSNLVRETGLCVVAGDFDLYSSVEFFCVECVEALFVLS